MPHAPADVTSWKPVVVDPATVEGARVLDELRAEHATLFVHDTIEEQIGDLLAAREPRRTLTADERNARVAEQLGGRPRDAYGRWVLYPWSRRLVHLLAPDDYRLLRSDRNRYKITIEQQARLHRCRIAIAGLSVGLATAVTLALEGVGGSFLLADFDTLGVSNLNRLRAGVHELGVNKAVLAARQLFELDPYLDIAIFPNGVAEETIDAFLGGESNIDLLVEECDDLAMKVRLRERASARGIPVVMETSDRGLLDVERFDLEPGRPPLHGALGTTSAAALRGLSTADKVPYVLGILGVDTLSTPMVASMIEVRQSTSTWPQLASAVALGGAVVTDAARRILLGTFRESGRYYVDLESIVRDGASAPLPSSALLTPPQAVIAYEPTVSIEKPRPGAGAPSADEIRYIVSYATLAPSPSNAQPWKFSWAHGALRCTVDVVRATTILDVGGVASYLALGAAIENATIAAGSLGLTTQITPVRFENAPSWELRFSRSSESSDAWSSRLAAVEARVTNRRYGNRALLRDADAAALVEAGRAEGCLFTMVTSSADIARVGELAGLADRVRFLNAAMHHELLAELRWSDEEARATRDGLELATLELSAADAAVMHVLRSRAALEWVAGIGGGTGLDEPARKAFASSSAAGVLAVQGSTPEAFFDAGRCLQRVWLGAAVRGIAVHPWTTAPYLVEAAKLRSAEMLTDNERRAIDAVKVAFDDVFKLPEGYRAAMLFRLSYADAPTGRALRRSLDDVLTFE